MNKLLLIFLLFLAASCQPADPEKLAEVSASYIQGTVPTITTKELAATLTKKKVLLLDTRAKKEFAVSHLPNARWVGYDDFENTRLPKVDKSTPIIVYCSVGYRSEKIGEKLKQAGYTNVRNLIGGIFAWANENRPLRNNAKQPTRSVHGYDITWSKYLSPSVITVLD